MVDLKFVNWPKKQQWFEVKRKQLLSAVTVKDMPIWHIKAKGLKL